VPGLRTAARAETGVPLTPDRTERVLCMPPAPFVVGVEARAGVRFAAPGDAAGLVVVESRAGVPGGGGFLAVVDMLATVLSVCVVVCVSVSWSCWVAI
jgi:hypothetical protein